MYAYGIVNGHKRAGIALLVCGVVCGCSRYHPETEELQRQFAGAVPAGSSPAQVTAYLDAAKLAHSAYRHDKATGNTIEAAMQVEAPHVIVKPSYDVVFHFDGQNRLMSAEVQYLGYVGI